MKKLFITLAILAYGCCVAQIKAQGEIEILSSETDEKIPYRLDEKKPYTLTEKKTYRSVEQMPQFPGGDAMMLKFIGANLQYPESAIKNGIQGQVIVRFVVTADGSVTDVKVLRSLDAACDKESIRIIKSMPKWIPGKQNGEVVDVYYTLPVRFKN